MQQLAARQASHAAASMSGAAQISNPGGISSSSSSSSSSASVKEKGFADGGQFLRTVYPSAMPAGVHVGDGDSSAGTAGRAGKVELDPLYARR